MVEGLDKWTWECPASDERCAICPIFKMDGLKLNDQSMTIPKGNGIGVAQPAVQTITSEAIEFMLNINNILANLYHLVLLTCMCKEELDATDFHAINKQHILS